MKERKPVIGITCNFDYRDAVGMVSGMEIWRQQGRRQKHEYLYIWSIQRRTEKDLL